MGLFMKTKLIDSMSLGYDNNTNYQKASSYKKLTRRDFLKYSIIGSAGLAIPVLATEDADAGWWWIPAILGGLAVTTTVIASGESTSGEIIIINESHKDMEGPMQFKLKKEEKLRTNQFQSSSSQDSSEKTIRYKIPARTKRTYTFTNGPSLIVEKDTKAILTVRSQLNEKSVNYKILAV